MDITQRGPAPSPDDSTKRRMSKIGLILKIIVTGIKEKEVHVHVHVRDMPVMAYLNVEDGV